MQPLSTWENLFLGAVALLVIFWMSPGIKAALTKSKNAQADWPSVLMLLAVVVIFVLALIMMVKK